MFVISMTSVKEAELNHGNCKPLVVIFQTGQCHERKKKSTLGSLIICAYQLRMGLIYYVVVVVVAVEVVAAAICLSRLDSCVEKKITGESRGNTASVRFYLPWAMRYNHKDTVQRKQRLSHTYGESAGTHYTNKNDNSECTQYSAKRIHATNA